MSRHYICVEEANEMIPFLRRSFQLLFQLHMHVRLLIDELECAGFAPQSDAFPVYVRGADEEIILARGQLRALIDLMQEELDRLRNQGCLMQDMEQGGVSWYAKHPRRGDILLSWRFGEPEVSFWFDPSTEEPIRRSLDELDDTENERFSGAGGVESGS